MRVPWQATTPRAGQTWRALFRLAVIAALLVLAACGGNAPAAVPRGNAAVVGPPPSDTPTAGTGLDERRALEQYQQFERTPGGYAYTVQLPQDRIVLYYGTPGAPLLGPIGAYSDAELMRRLRAQAAAYQQADPAHPVVAGLDLVTPIVQPFPTENGLWVTRVPDDQILHYANLARANRMLFFMDMQVGHSTNAREVSYLLPYLARPEVHLAIDPEWEMAPGAIPGVHVGRTYAADINALIDQLSALVQAKKLPPKILIIHKFRAEVAPDWQNIKLKPGVQVVVMIDAVGPPGPKTWVYNMFSHDVPQYVGFKLFQDIPAETPVMTPKDVLALNPPPIIVMYQ